MTISVTNITTGSSTSGATVAITTGIAVPVGAMIVIAVCDASTSGSGSCTDSGSNVYTGGTLVGLNNAQGTNGFVRIFTAPVKTALTAANTITYTKGASGTVACVSAFFAQGTLGLIDTGINNTATGSSTSPSVTSGTPQRSGSLFIACVGYGNSGTYTQDATHNWATPFTAVTGSTTRGLGGGNQIGGATVATIIFNPTLGTTGVWGAVVTGLQQVIGGFDQQGSRETMPLVQQPTRRKAAAAVMRGIDSNELPFQLWRNAGWEVQPPPPRIAFNNRSSGLRQTPGFAFYPLWINAGWEIQPPPPPHLPKERRGAMMPKEDGQEWPFILWNNFGWEVQPPPPPHLAIERRAGAVMPKEDGQEWPLINWQNFGWEMQPTAFWKPPLTRPSLFPEGVFPPVAAAVVPQLNFFETAYYMQRRPARTMSALKHRSEFAFFDRWINFGWEQTFAQPPHRRFNSPDIGDTGTEAPFVAAAPVLVAWPFDQIYTQPIHKWWKQPDFGDQGIQFPFRQWINTGWEVAPPLFRQSRYTLPSILEVGDTSGLPFYQFWRNAGWEVQPPQPPHRWFRGHGLRGDDGTTLPFVNWLNWGWEQSHAYTRHPIWKAPSIGDPLGIDFGLINFFPFGFEQTATQPVHRFWKSPDVGDAGNEATFTFIPPGFVAWPFDPTFSQDPRRRWERSAAFMRGPDGTDAPLINWFNWGWDIQPPPPPHPVRRGHGLAGVDAIELPYQQWRNWGWEVQHPQPPHRLFRGHTLKGDDGTSYVFYNWINGGWEIIPPQPPHPRPERSGALMRGDDGSENIFNYWLNFGWEQTQAQPKHPLWKSPDTGDTGTEAVFIFVPPAQVPLNFFEVMESQDRHPRPERFAALVGGDQGNELPFIFWNNAGWEVQPWQPPHWPRQYRGAFLRGDDGSENIYQMWRNWGWEVQPPPPPRRPWERRGAILIGDPGNEAPYVQWRNWGWEIQPPPPPRNRWERRGAFLFGDVGNQVPLTPWFNWGWEQTFAQPPHWPRQWRGGILRGDDGTEAPFIFVAPAPPPPFYEGPPVTFRWPASYGRKGSALVIGDTGIVFPFIPPVIPPVRSRRSQGLFTIDTVQGYILGNQPIVNKPWTMIFYVGPFLTGGRILLTFTRPDGTLQVGDPDFAFIGKPTITQIRINDEIGGEYIVYTFAQNELNQVGTWKVSAIAANFFSNTYSFTVLPTPVC